MTRSIVPVVVGLSLLGSSVAWAAERTPGQLVWATHYSEGSSSEEVPTEMVASGDGSRVFVAGSTTFGGQHSYVLVAYTAASGNQLWVQHYPSGSSVGFAQIAASPDGSKVFIAVHRTWGLGQFSADAVAFDAATGARLWVNRVRGPENASDVFDMTVSPDGSTVYVTGDTFTPDQVYEMTTAAYDTTTGARRWLARHAATGSGGVQGFAVAASPTGDRVFVTGSNYGGTELPDYVTVGYEAATGSELWTTTYDGPGHGSDYPRDVKVSPDGSRLFVTGVSPNSSDGVDAATLSLNASDGARLWVDRFDSGHADAANHAAVSPDGSTVVVAGSVIVAYDASSGSRLWSSRVRHLAYSGVAVSPDSSTIYAAGGLAEPLLARESYVTKAFRGPTGVVLWEAKSQTSPCSYGWGLALAPDGARLYVTGVVPDVQSGCGSEFGTEDFGTVAYSGV